MKLGREARQASFLPAHTDNTQATVLLSFNSNDVPPVLSGTAEGRPFECTTIDRIAQ